MSLRDDHASNKRLIESTAEESDYDNAVNSNVWLMDGGWRVLQRCGRASDSCRLGFVFDFRRQRFATLAATHSVLNERNVRIVFSRGVELKCSFRKL